MMKKFRNRFVCLVCSLIALLPAPASASDLTAERVWTNPEGKTFRGTWVRTYYGGQQVEIRDSSGKVFVIDFASLSEADRQLVIAGQQEEPGAAEAFKVLPALNRGELPVISQGDFGNKASDCVPSSFCNFLLWWDQAGVLEIPKRGDFESKAEWVHSRVARYCETRNNSGTYVGDATQGFSEYFKKDLADQATLKIRIDYDLRPENLARYTVGENATMLGMTIRRGPRHDSGHWVALVSASADGTVVFHTWGARFEGKLEVLEHKPEPIRMRTGDRTTQTVPATIYEIKIRNPQNLPEWFRNSDTKFILDPALWDFIYVLKPFVYQEKGKPANAPADSLLDPPKS